MLIFFIIYNTYINTIHTSWKFPVPSNADVEKKATPIKVPKVAPIVLVIKLRGDATKTPMLITIDPSKWFIPYTTKIIEKWSWYKCYNFECILYSANNVLIGTLDMIWMYLVPWIVRCLFQPNPNLLVRPMEQDKWCALNQNDFLQ